MAQQSAIASASQFIARHLPGGRQRAIRQAFMHGYHCGEHNGDGTPCDSSCDRWESIAKTPWMVPAV